MFAPEGLPTTIIPVGEIQVGCWVTLATGATGGAGTGLTTNTVADEMHRVTRSFAVTLYEPSLLQIAY